MCFKRKWTKFTPTQNYLDAVKDITTISKLKAFLKKITYTSEKIDVWQTPEETFNRGKGDCDDYARLSLDILVRIQKRKDVRFVIYTGYKEKDGVEKYSGHAVCVFPNYSSLGVFSNSQYFYNKDNLIEVGHIFYPKGIKYMEVRNDEGNVTSRKFKLFGRM